MTPFLIILFSIYGLLSFYLYRKFLRGPWLSQRSWRFGVGALVVSIATIFSSMFIHRVMRVEPRSPMVAAYSWAALTLMGFMGTLVLYSFMTDLFRPIAWAKRKWRRHDSAADAGRRLFLARSGRTSLLGMAFMSTGVGLGQAVSGPQVKKVQVPVDGLHSDLRGLKIVQISDLHVGPTIDRSYVENVVAIANSLNADLVALTGDFVDGTVEHLGSDIAPLSQLKSKYGIFYCTGNHEFYSGVQPWTSEFRRMGFRVLENTHDLVRVGGARLLVGGVHDISSAKRFGGVTSDPAGAIKNAPDSDFRLLLAHQPKSCVDAVKAGWDLQLSGHTHAGQFFPFSLLVYFAHPYIKGLHHHEGKMWIYVNQGTGYWGPPLRLGVPAEITELTLV